MLAQILEMLEAYGLWGMLILCFAEASFLPVPPELLYVPVCVTRPGKALLYALLATLATTGGAFFGYVLGKVFGHPLLHRLVSPKRVEKIEGLFQRYGVWVVFMAGVAPPPTPFKIFTISSGIFALNTPRFLLAALSGRSLRYLLEAILIWRGGREALNILKSKSLWITLLVLLVLVVAFLVYQNYIKPQMAEKTSEGRLLHWWRRVISGEGRALNILGEWTIALGSAGFLVFFLVDVFSELGSVHLQLIDHWAGQWISPYLGRLGDGLSQVLGPVLLTLSLLSACFIWWKEKRKDKIVFLFFNMIGSALVLTGFYRVITESQRLSGGPNPMPMAIVNILWASFILWLTTGGRPSLRGRRLLDTALGLVFLTLLALSRLAAGYLLSDVLISYAAAGLWLAVLWIIFLYRGTPEHTAEHY
ncbi:MAG: VTT domain-containing protein [Syntrophomonas sp.]